MIISLNLRYVQFLFDVFDVSRKGVKMAALLYEACKDVQLSDFERELIFIFFVFFCVCVGFGFVRRFFSRKGGKDVND